MDYEKEFDEIQEYVNKKVREITDDDRIESAVGGVSVVPKNRPGDEEGTVTLGVDFAANVEALDALQMMLDVAEENIKNILNSSENNMEKLLLLMMLQSRLSELVDNVTKSEKENLGIENELETEENSDDNVGVDTNAMPDFVKDMLSDEEISGLENIVDDE